MKVIVYFETRIYTVSDKFWQTARKQIERTKLSRKVLYHFRNS